MSATEQRLSLVEPLGPGLNRVWELSEVLVDFVTPYQHLVIGRTSQGVSLFCDGERQSTEASQLVYHEALFVPALLLADRVDRVLVIGSSEGVVSELAAAAGALRVDHVDVDAAAVRACAEHLPYGYRTAALENAEAGAGVIRMHYADGWDFVAEATTRGTEYDIVVIDLPDEQPGGEAQHNRLYGTEFLSGCAGLLAPGGVVCSQAGCPTLWRNETLRRSWRRFHESFDEVVYFGSDEHEWAFLSGRKDPLGDPVTAMTARLPAARYRPACLDADALRSGSVPPYSIRVSGPR